MYRASCRTGLATLVLCLASFSWGVEGVCKSYADTYVQWAKGINLDQTFETSNQVSEMCGRALFLHPYNLLRSSSFSPLSPLIQSKMLVRGS